MNSLLLRTTIKSTQCRGLKEVRKNGGIIRPLLAAAGSSPSEMIPFRSHGSSAKDNKNPNKPSSEQDGHHDGEPRVQDGDEAVEVELVELWNKDGPAGPEWKGPRGYEPTTYGDWSTKGRVSDF